MWPDLSLNDVGEKFEMRTLFSCPLGVFAWISLDEPVPSKEELSEGSFEDKLPETSVDALLILKYRSE